MRVQKKTIPVGFESQKKRGHPIALIVHYSPVERQKLTI